MILKNNLNILNDSLLTTKCMKNHCFDKKETKKLQFFFLSRCYSQSYLQFWRAAFSLVQNFSKIRSYEEFLAYTYYNWIIHRKFHAVNIWVSFELFCYIARKLLILSPKQYNQIHLNVWWIQNDIKCSNGESNVSKTNISNKDC